MSEINSEKIVKSYIYGNTLEMTTANGQQAQIIKVIDGRRYVNLETGEIHNMNTSRTTRLDNLKSTKQTMKKIRRIVAHNFTGGKNQLWVTLTYRNHITDAKVVYNDFKIFIRRLRKTFGNIEYISVIEPQASGRWHLHILIKNDSVLVIPNHVLSKLWGQGFTKTKRLKKADKIGNYLVSYLSNLELVVNNLDSEKKSIVKGGRLYMYPKGIRIYRTSRGIRKPLEITTNKEHLLETYKIQKPPSFSRTTKHITPIGIKEYTTEFYDDVNMDR